MKTIVARSDYFARMELVLAHGFPMPMEYHAAQGEESPLPFTLQLQNYRNGTGPQLPAFDPARVDATTKSELERRPPIDGFLAYDDPVFPTPFREALRAAQEDATTRAWLDANPDAVLAQVEHRMGRPDGGIIDGWTFWWGSPSDKSEDPGLFVTVDKHRPLVPVLGESFTVGTQNLPGSFKPINYVPWVTLEALADTHRRLLGEEPEVLRCQFMRDFCKISTHENTGEAYAGQSYMSFVSLGLRVWLSTGWILNDTSGSTYAIGPPVE